MSESNEPIVISDTESESAGRLSDDEPILKPKKKKNLKSRKRTVSESQWSDRSTFHESSSISREVSAIPSNVPKSNRSFDYTTSFQRKMFHLKVERLELEYERSKIEQKLRELKKRENHAQDEFERDLRNDWNESDKRKRSKRLSKDLIRDQASNVYDLVKCEILLKASREFIVQSKEKRRTNNSFSDHHFCKWVKLRLNRSDDSDNDDDNDDCDPQTTPLRKRYAKRTRVDTISADITRISPDLPKKKKRKTRPNRSSEIRSNHSEDWRRNHLSEKRSSMRNSRDMIDSLEGRNEEDTNLGRRVSSSSSVSSEFSGQSPFAMDHRSEEEEEPEDSDDDSDSITLNSPNDWRSESSDSNDFIPLPPGDPPSLRKFI